MTDLRQAAQQALETLEGWDNYGAWVWPESALEQSKQNTTDSIAALRTALEQPEQEPVAWREFASDYERGVIDGMQKQAQSSVDKAVNAMVSRSWVRLTDEEKKKIATAAGCTDDDDGHIVTEIFRLAEAKLKERNGQ